MTPTKRREFTGPRGEPREKSASSSRFSCKDLASRSEARPARRLGSCFKISSLLFLVILTLFLLRRLWCYTQAIIQYSP